MLKDNLIFPFSISLFVAMVLSILPMPTWSVWFRPEWLLLLVFFWIIVFPKRFSLLGVWLIGLLTDILLGTLLGVHALAMVFVSYFMFKFYRQIRAFPYWQQALVIAVLTIVYETTIVIVQSVQGHATHWYFYLPSLLSFLLWPWIYVMLYELHTWFDLEMEDEYS